MDDSIAVNKPTTSGDRVAHAIALRRPLLHARRVRALAADPRPPLPDRPVRGRAALGRRSDLLPPGFEGLASLAQPYQGYLHVGARMVAIVAAAIPPALAPLLMNAVTILVTAGVAAFIASDRLRTARPGPAAAARPGHRVRADAGRAGSVVAPRLPPMEPGLLPADPGARRRAGTALGLARPGGRRHRGPDRAVLDPLRAALPVAPTAPRRHDLDRRRVRRRPARRRVHRLSRAGGRDDAARGGRRPRHAPLRRAAARLSARPGCSAAPGSRSSPARRSWSWSLGLLVVAGSVIPRRDARRPRLRRGGRRGGRHRPVGRPGGEPPGRLGRRSLLPVRHRGDHRHRHRVADRRQGTTGSGGPGSCSAGCSSSASSWTSGSRRRPPSAGPSDSACIGGADPCVVPVFPGGDWDLHWPGR